ncbi:hypothetical protein SBA3_1460010 [Candidatus Sulfopaludibacter sp. SbA3]|nr:hypothetical protein SBA3_1460010 [Candidatus Sulfopaludibacter sp. SbA3]
MRESYEPIVFTNPCGLIRSYAVERLGSGSLTLCDCSDFFLTAIGQVTTNPSEVISGSRSIKGSYTGSGTFTPYLRSKPALTLMPSNIYRITFRYRILVTPS